MVTIRHSLIKTSISNEKCCDKKKREKAEKEQKEKKAKETQNQRELAIKTQSILASTAAKVPAGIATPIIPPPQITPVDAIQLIQQAQSQRELTNKALQAQRTQDARTPHRTEHEHHTPEKALRAFLETATLVQAPRFTPVNHEKRSEPISHSQKEVYNHQLDLKRIAR